MKKFLLLLVLFSTLTACSTPAIPVATIEQPTPVVVVVTATPEPTPTFTPPPTAEPTPDISDLTELYVSILNDSGLYSEWAALWGIVADGNLSESQLLDLSDDIADIATAMETLSIPTELQELHDTLVRAVWLCSAAVVSMAVGADEIASDYLDESLTLLEQYTEELKIMRAGG